MRLSLLVLSSLALLCPLTSFADRDPDCPARAEADAVRAEFKWEIEGPAYSHCDLSNNGYRVVKALLLLKDIARDFDGSSPFGTSVIGTDPFAFVKERVRKIVVEAPSSRCDSPVHAEFEMPNLVRVFCRAGTTDILEIASTLVHEARHNPEGRPGIFQHVECTRGWNLQVSQDTCDASWGGSWSAEVEFLIGASRSRRTSESERAQARKLAKEILIGQINRPAGDLKQGAALRGADGELYFYDGKQITELASSTPADSVMWLSIRGVEFVNSNGRVSTYVSKDQIIDAKIVNATKDLSESESAKLTGYFQFGRGAMQCALLTDELICFGPRGEKKRMKIRGANAVGFMHVDESVRWFGASSDGLMYVLTDDGKALPVPGWANFGTFDDVADFSARGAIKWHGTSLNPYMLKLSLSGDLQLLEWRREPVPAPGVQGMKFTEIVGKTLWSETLEKLARGEL